MPVAVELAGGHWRPGVATSFARSGEIGHAASMKKPTKTKGISWRGVAVALVALGLFAGVVMLGASLHRLVQ
jgi:hypothetical protein